MCCLFATSRLYPLVAPCDTIIFSFLAIAMQIAPQSVRPAPLLRHLAAMFYDAFLLLACIIVLGFVFLFINHGEDIRPGNPLQYALRTAIAATSLFFYAYFWSHQSQTLGMRAWRLVVVDERGGSPRLWQAALRWFMALITLLPFGIGLWWRFFDREKRTLYDIFSRTRLFMLTENPYKKPS